MARALVALALMLGATAMTAIPARAELVEVTTTLDVADTHDADGVKAALKEAVEHVLSDTIAFEPTMVALTDARMVGKKLLVRLLIADEEGEQMLRALQAGGAPGGDEGESASPDEEETRI
ncbi:MAG TPA: hypothetical protein VFL90_09960 [Methylomirabilota bacterium]|nr:hypothetical protein [Methylomirabilota bacterium]